MERRRLAGMKPASLFHHRKIKKFKKILKNEKGFQGQQLAHLVFENLSQKRRFWVIEARTFFRVGWCAGRNIQKFNRQFPSFFSN
jgi:hypothetical protein